MSSDPTFKSGESIGVVYNPGAHTHYSYAIRDAIEAAQVPVIELRIFRMCMPARSTGTTRSSHRSRGASLWASGYRATRWPSGGCTNFMRRISSTSRNRASGRECAAGSGGGRPHRATAPRGNRRQPVRRRWPRSSTRSRPPPRSRRSTRSRCTRRWPSCSRADRPDGVILATPNQLHVAGGPGMRRRPACR